MIRSFKSRATEKIFSRQRSDEIPEDIQRLAMRELRDLDRTPVARDAWVRMTGNSHGEPGDHPGRYTIPVGDKWRISFSWRDGHAYDVDIADGWHTEGIDPR
jgi:proteic killer suppression protein